MKTLGGLLTGCAIVISAPAQAQGQTREFNIPAGELHRALSAFTRQSRLQIIYRVDQVRGARTNGVRGRMQAEAALDALLAGSGFTAHRDRSGAIAIVRNSPTAAADDDDDEPSSEQSESAVLVTGTRIRGAPPAAPVITITSDEMRNAGHTDLGEVVRSIPQNFNGGQNPGIGTGDGPRSANVTSASSLNLRGLGPGATLTLLNGRRLAYTGETQAVDISVIPLAAVDRIEIVADGGSALYGSDAVGGVANIILRRDYHGATATGRIGAATDGGYTRYQLSAAAGTRWDNGNFLIAGDFSRNTAITAGQRSYTSTIHPSASLYPLIRNWSVLGSGRQEVVDGVSVTLDALYNNRFFNRNEPSTTAASFRTSGSEINAEIASVLVSPGIEFSLPAGWRLAVNGGYGAEQDNDTVIVFANGAQLVRQDIDRRNTLWTVDANLEGPLFALPGGTARLAVGGGYRDVGLRSIFTVNSTTIIPFEWSRDSFHAYGELYLPLISPANGVRGMDRLSISAALRYENYPGLESVVTPKFGVNFSPMNGLTLSGSWGRSFKAATLGEQFGTSNAILRFASAIGGSGFPATATAIVLGGSNPSLAPERSTNWTATATLEPAAIPEARFQVSYFDIDYTDRIAAPITSSGLALANPVFAQFVTLAPTQAQISDAIATSSTSTLLNATGQPVNLANVAAIVDGRLTNVARQRARGVDVAASYRVELGDRSSLLATFGASYLDMARQISEGQAMIPLAGRIFNPPNWRARSGLTWTSERATVSVHGNYIGSLEDARTAATYSIGSQVTFDLFGSYRIISPTSRRAIDFQIAVINALNAEPERLISTNPVLTPFDSTNYSAIGRTVTFSVTTNF